MSLEHGVGRWMVLAPTARSADQRFLSRSVRAIPVKSLALERLLNHGINYGKIADQVLWESVAISQVGDAVRTHPDPIIVTLPDEHFEGQIKCEERRSNHEWSATFWIAKDQHVGLLHREPDAFRFATMVNVGKEGQIATVYGLLEAFQCLFHRKRAGSGHNSLD